MINWFFSLLYGVCSVQCYLDQNFAFMIIGTASFCAESFRGSSDQLKMSNDEHLADQFEKDDAEHIADQYEKDGMGSHHGGKQRTKKESEMNTNRQNPAGHERKIATKLMNAEKNQKAAERRINLEQEKRMESLGDSKKEPMVSGSILAN